MKCARYIVTLADNTQNTQGTFEPVHIQQKLDNQDHRRLESVYYVYHGMIPL